MSNYYKDCTITIKNNVATLSEQLYLYKNDKNIELYFTIVNKPYNLPVQNLLRQVDVDLAKVKMMKDDGSVKKTFPIQALVNGKVRVLITEELTDDDIELGKYSFQIRLYNSTQNSTITLPIVFSSINILEPLFDDEDDFGDGSHSTIAMVDKAIVGTSTVG